MYEVCADAASRMCLVLVLTQAPGESTLVPAEAAEEASPDYMANIRYSCSTRSNCVFSFRVVRTRACIDAPVWYTSSSPLPVSWSFSINTRVVQRDGESIHEVRNGDRGPAVARRAREEIRRDVDARRGGRPREGWAAAGRGNGVFGSVRGLGHSSDGIAAGEGQGRFLRHVPRDGASGATALPTRPIDAHPTRSPPPVSSPLISRPACFLSDPSLCSRVWCARSIR